MQLHASYQVHLNMISNGELSDPLCDIVKRGLTLVRLRFGVIINQLQSSFYGLFQNIVKWH